MRNRIISLAIVLFAGCAFGAQPRLVSAPLTTEAGHWQSAGVLPNATRGLVANGQHALIGFSADGKTQEIFVATSSNISQTHPLESPPKFYAFAHDASGSRFCIPIGSSAYARSLVCYDASLHLSASSLPVVTTSGAFLGKENLWVVDPSGKEASKRTSLVLLGPSQAGWIEVRRAISPLCTEEDSDLECGELEIHPVGESSLAVVPLLGRFDGERLIYPAFGVWNPATHALRRVNSPALTVDTALRASYRSFGDHPMRVVYRSAASRGGKIAVIPALPGPADQPVRRSELWVFDESGRITKIPAPSQLNAVTFDGEDPVAVTVEGAALRWKP